MGYRQAIRSAFKDHGLTQENLVELLKGRKESDLLPDIILGIHSG